MATREPTLEALERITELARRWGKIIVREQWGEDGPGFDVDLDQMEQVALAAVRGLLAGTLETATQNQARTLGEQHPCPDCNRRCPLVTEDRTVTTGEGSFEHHKPKAHCPTRPANGDGREGHGDGDGRDREVHAHSSRPQ
jgi:hypothetical protein